MNEKLLRDIQVLLSRLVAKAPQLVGNFTTNLAKAWMHIRSRFDGGKVINRSQSSSWEHHCMGARLQQNLGPNWGLQSWNDMTHSQPNKIFQNTVESSTKKAEKDRKRKATENAKES